MTIFVIMIWHIVKMLVPQLSGKWPFTWGPDFMSMEMLVNCRFCRNSTSAWQLQTNATSPECISSHAQDHSEVQLEEYFSCQIRRALSFGGAALHTEPAQIHSFRGFTTTRRTQAPPRSRGWPSPPMKKHPTGAKLLFCHDLANPAVNHYTHWFSTFDIAIL